jgi:UDP-glucose 4-epimerase
MKIAITGNAGFIGSHVADACRAAGHAIVGIDIRNKKPIDITDQAALIALFKKERPDAVSHHAGIISVAASMRDPNPTFVTNTLGTVNVLLAAGAAGTVKKFIFASSSAVYGNARTIPVAESAPAAPQSPYGISKLWAEEAVSFYSALYGFAYTIFRYSNVYGPRQKPHNEGGVVAIFTHLMANGMQPTVFGDGTKTRDYTHVDDIVRANMAALTKGKNEIINLGHGKKIRDATVFKEIAKNAGFAGQAFYAPRRAGEIEHMAVDASKAARLLRWRPKIPFERGVAAYVRSIARRRDA